MLCNIAGQMKSSVILVLLCSVLCIQAAVNPIVFFPGYSFSKLAVTVTGGNIDGCPTSGSFVVEFGMANPQNEFSEVCMFKYLSLAYDADAAVGKKFTNRNDVTVTIPGRETGSLECIGSLSSYSQFFDFLATKGYANNGTTPNLLAACYDWRIDPTNDAIAGPSFLNNSIALIEKAYTSNGNRKVWLVGHSNGPIMTLYLLNQVSDTWKNTYVAGFIPISGNFAGVGAFIAAVFLNGLSVVDFTFNPATAEVMQHWSANIFSAAQPDVFSGDKAEIVLRTLNPPRNYTTIPTDIDSIYEQANLTFLRENWRNFVGISSPSNPPDVYTYAIWGTGFDTAIGIIIDSFNNTAIVDYILAEGDINQEATCNESPKIWNSTMPAGCFQFETFNIDHFSLTNDVSVSQRIFDIVSAGVPSACPYASTTTSTTTVGSTTTTTGSQPSTTSNSAKLVYNMLLGVVVVFVLGLML